MDLTQHLASRDRPRGTVLITHGYGEHSGRYSALTDALISAGYDVVTWDLPGHGSSAGPRACVDVGRIIGDHLGARRQALAQARTEELVLFGHSMGGIITAASAELDGTRLRAVILTGPALRPDPAMPPRLARLLLPLARLVPGLPTAHLDARLVSRDQAVVSAYEADPMVHHARVPLLTALTMIVQGDQVIRNAATLSAPTLIVHGGHDRLSHVEGSQEFLESTRDAEVHLRIVDGAFHEVLNEPEGPALVEEILAWLDRH